MKQKPTATHFDLGFWLGQEIAKIPERYQDRVKAMLQRQFEELNGRGSALAQEVETMSRAFGELPTPLHIALLRWRGETVSDELLKKLDEWNARMAALSKAAAPRAARQTQAPPTPISDAAIARGSQASNASQAASEGPKT